MDHLIDGDLGDTGELFFLHLANRLKQLEPKFFARSRRLVRKAVETRRRAGDASVLDVNVARADLTEVQRQLSAATTAETKATAKLLARFPTLKYEPGPRSDPSPTAFGAAQWRERILAASNSIRVAEWTLKKAELAAARAKADRIPDPTVGIYTASEAFRSERIVGLSLSIPLSGSYRDARMRQALQEAELRARNSIARAASRRQRSSRRRSRRAGAWNAGDWPRKAWPPRGIAPA